MTDNLFIFCIGGTGARILKSLTFLLAAGVPINANRIIPILIDPDRANGDVTRTIEILNKYQNIRAELEFDKNNFYQTEIQTLSSLASMVNTDPVRMNSHGFRFAIDGVQEGKFSDFIGYNQLKTANRALLSALFSEKNLNAELEVGFKGNPHMGSIVLNRFSESEEFKFFASRFGENDKVFIVSSIFGGTGAAGFPLLVKNLRNPKPNISNPARLREAAIGALTVKPYFGVIPDKGSEIDKGTFITKTKEALRYYEKHITGANLLNAVYYIGDKESTDYENNEGRESQKNHAHLVETLGALAIVDFAGISKEKLQATNGRANKPIYRRYSLNKHNVSNGEIRFNNLGKKSRDLIYQPLVQYAYAVQFWANNMNSIPGDPWAKKGRVIYENSFLTNDFFAQDLKQFNSRFVEWLEEMRSNTRSFAPLRLNVERSLLHTVVEGFEVKKTWFSSGTWDYFDYTKHLNQAAKKVGELPVNQKFMATFYKATEEIFNNRIKQ